MPPSKPRFSRETLCPRLQWSDVDRDYLRQLAGLAKIEDLAGAGLAHRPDRLGDVTSALFPENTIGAAHLVAREPMVVCGLELIPVILEAYSEECFFKATASDGESVEAGQLLGELRGPAEALLQSERILLNYLQHLSGIATETRRYVTTLGNGPTALLDTRKTIPGLRVLEKFAFACGGGYNHRMGLFDRVMLKDNHLALAGATGGNRLSETVARAREVCGDLPVEVEVDAINQIHPVLEAGADIIMFDNFSLDELKTGVEMVADAAWTEASGGIQLDQLAQYGELGLDFVSTGAPVHQSAWKDIALDWQSTPHKQAT
ncbi:MAG: carboxylating nicotinate-nucleotide diphosphorylase [Opitutales bacterium]